ncbi:hypothetical protein VNO77_04190 [Canavalia gladiata]|uniref:Uncharacterized protein n=1 Tax=Canavalia gladiata TaxID=3824 RepID=A0AAN9R4L3_CANGL
MLGLPWPLTCEVHVPEIAKGKSTCWHLLDVLGNALTTWHSFLCVIVLLAINLNEACCLTEYSRPGRAGQVSHYSQIEHITAYENLESIWAHASRANQPMYHNQKPLSNTTRSSPPSDVPSPNCYDQSFPEASVGSWNIKDELSLELHNAGLYSKPEPNLAASLLVYPGQAFQDVAWAARAHVLGNQ